MENQDDNSRPKNKPPKGAGAYTNIAVKMAAVILAGALGGRELDGAEQYGRAGDEDEGAGEDRHRAVLVLELAWAGAPRSLARGRGAPFSVLLDIRATTRFLLAPGEKWGFSKRKWGLNGGGK